MSLFIKTGKCKKDKIKNLNLSSNINNIFSFCFNNLIRFDVLTSEHVFVTLFKNILDFMSSFGVITKT